MATIEIYNNGRMIDVKAYELKGNKRIPQTITTDLISLINTISNEKTIISNIKEAKTDVKFNYQDNTIVIKNYDILKGYPLFNELKEKINRIYRLEKLNNGRLDRLKVTSSVSILTVAAVASFAMISEAVKGIDLSKITKVTNSSLSEYDEDEDTFFKNENPFFIIKEGEKVANKITSSDIEIIKEKIAPPKKSKEDFDSKKSNKSIEIQNNLLKTESTDYKPIKLSYEDRTANKKFLNCKKKYGDVITKWANIYGLDPNLMIAVATQEGGIHNPDDLTGGAVGLMKIEYNVWKDKDISCYNYKTNSVDKLTLTDDVMSNLNTNVQAGCMIMRQQLDYMKNNPMAALQSYNFGYGNMMTILEEYAKDNYLTVDEVLWDFNELEWLEYRHLITDNKTSYGDKNYIENVMSYFDSDTLNYYTNDNNLVSIEIGHVKTSKRV